MKGYCCECGKNVALELVGGKDIYPHREDLYHLEFWRCPKCKNYTGKYEGEYPTLPSDHIRKCRYIAHRQLDSIWRDRKLKGEYYSYMSNIFKRDFHWGMVRSDKEADRALYYTQEFLDKEEK